jgi:hypothetical protein
MKVKAVFTIKNLPGAFTEVVEPKSVTPRDIKAALQKVLDDLPTPGKKVNHVVYMEQVQ